MLDYDFPLFRPPSEGGNLIIQATLGCSFNQCSFCSMYRSKHYRPRPLAEVFTDIDTAARGWPTAHRVFLADGDAFVLPTEDLLAICDRLRRRFPDLQRVSAYATPLSLLKKSPEEMAALKAARLSLLYLGIESGSPQVLKRVAKGASPRGLIDGITKATEAGLKISATVINGLGGQGLWREHVDGTIAVVNAAPPTFLSILQLVFHDPATEQLFLTRFPDYAPQDDAAVLDELERLIAGLAPPRPVIFRSNHASNALPLAGNLPKDRDSLLDQIRLARAGLRRMRPRDQRGF
jgi:radical SAM superfamily enzyme YgiQ (UPF0313 family)